MAQQPANPAPQQNTAQEQPKADDANPVEPKADEPKIEEPKAEEPKAEEPKPEA